MSAYIVMCMYLCIVLDVENGFGLVPSRQLNVIIGDEVHVECKANKFVYTEPALYLVDGVDETPLTSGEGLEITPTM